MDIIDNLEEDYTWDFLCRKEEFNVYKGFYGYADYVIVEDFEFSEESMLYFFPLEMRDDLRYDTRADFDPMLSEADFCLEGIYIDDEDDIYSLYKDEDDAYLLVYINQKHAKVYEDISDLIELLKEDIAYSLPYNTMFSEKDDSKKIDYVLLYAMYRYFK